FDNKRSGADGGFIYFRGDLSHTHDLPGGMQAFAKIQGQASSQPLINSEQISGGGLGNVRGYLESEALGDDGVFTTLELRSPSLLGKGGDDKNDWRVYAFVEGGLLSLQKPLPGQDSGSTLGSIGFGTRGRLFDHFNGSIDAGLPVVRRDSGLPLSLSYTFRLWGDF
ncbi:MAG: ShlB/FhaC/HecB family hemolysin secretion/activation protein, partial [Verrucomicrobiales bacterium]